MECYKNKDWLYNQYCVLKKGPVLIGIEQNRTRETIYNWLKKFNIKIRSKGESNYLRYNNSVVLCKNTIDFINGELLGDGCVFSNNNFSAKYLHSSKYEEYLNWLLNELRNFNIKSNNVKKDSKKQFKKYYYRYSSYSYPELLLIRHKWYPNGKKIVPRDIELTPITCRQWYIGDGYLNKKYNFIQLCTCGFNIQDIEFLVLQLNNLGFNCHRTNKNTIYIPRKYIINFLNYIGPCPVECYKYKWEIECIK